MKDSPLLRKCFLALCVATLTIFYPSFSLATTRGDIASAGLACEPALAVGQKLIDLRATFAPRGAVFKHAGPQTTLVGQKAGILFFVHDQWVCRLTTDAEGTVVSVKKIR